MAYWLNCVLVQFASSLNPFPISHFFFLYPSFLFVDSPNNSTKAQKYNIKKEQITALCTTVQNDFYCFIYMSSVLSSFYLVNTNSDSKEESVLPNSHLISGSLTFWSETWNQSFFMMSTSVQTRHMSHRTGILPVSKVTNPIYDTEITVCGHFVK